MWITVQFPNRRHGLPPLRISDLATALPLLLVSPMSIDYEVATPLTLTVPDLERRTAKRFRFSLMMPATFGRGDAMMLDIGSGGARLRHFMVHARGSDVRLSFAYAHHRFSVTARVL